MEEPIIKEIKYKTIEYKGLENPEPPKEKNSSPPKVSEINNVNDLPKTLLTKKTEDNYTLMMKYFKEGNYIRGDQCAFDGIINYDDFSSDKFLGLVSDEIKMNSNNKNKIEDFLQRNTDDIKFRQDNNRHIEDRIKSINDSTKIKLYFNNKQLQQEYFDSFYNKQLEYKNNYKEHLERLSQKYNEERKKSYMPEKKAESNLDYFQNNEPVKISKYSFKAKNMNRKNKNNNEEIIKENNDEKDNENENQKLKQKLKKYHTFGSKMNENNHNNSNYNNGNHNNSNNNNNNIIDKDENRKLKKIKSGPLLDKNEIKLTRKEIEELTNKLHYDGELLKIKRKMISENMMNVPNDNINNFMKEKLTRSSIIILIKKLLYEYSTSIKKNTYTDYMKNPKLNYEQYIDILKDLYYLENNALPEDFLDDDTMYKELWNKLVKFSDGPENSIESNVLLLYLLELNGFFNNKKIIKELENEIYWIKLEEYDDLIANAKYIESNWNDLKNAKIQNIKKLKLEGKYNPKHCEGLYNNHLLNINNNISNLNLSQINKSTSHYITTFKGNTNYHMIHGYNPKTKDNENSLLGRSFNNKNEENKHNSSSISNASNKNFRNRIPLKDSYKDLMQRKRMELENKKKDEEKKLKEICTFKPQINNNMNKKIFTNLVKVELPKHKKNKSVNLYNSSITQENTNNNININQNTLTSNNQNLENINDCNNNSIIEKNLIKNSNHNYLSIKNSKNSNQSHSPVLRNKKKNMKRNKSSLQKMFNDNPLKNDKLFNEKIQQLRISKINNGKDIDNYNYTVPMRFDIEYQNKFDGIGVSINRDSNLKKKTQNVIFYNIKVNDKIKTLKYFEGDDLKLDVINFVRKNKLPDDVLDIILTKIKEKTLEEIS